MIPNDLQQHPTDFERDSIDRRFSIAPMMDWTDRHYRYFARLISQKSLLYTEMVTTGAILFGDQSRHLDYSKQEHPLALQLGGSTPDDLARCTEIANRYNYSEVNLNIGCPSDRVQNNMIGACLMAHADLVKNCLIEMRNVSNVPVTVKHRIGIDEQDDWVFLKDFVGTVSESGCKTFIVHARKAILSGLSPKENREIPPLIYERVYQLKRAFPDLEIIINGGIQTITECLEHLQFVDGVMIGRAAYQNPWILSQVDETLYGSEANTNTRHDILRAYFPYVESQLASGQKLSYMTRHILGLFHGCPGGKKFRRFLSENAHKPDAGLKTLEEAMKLVPENNSQPVQKTT